ncbi:glycosyltransferase family 2 protein [Microbacteriaceae bacterium VKM Ac-2854]|nr:glycosyltransferase family 2 protein [Microbacteriaceae bacterium VKM Ac-2854]
MSPVRYSKRELADRISRAAGRDPRYAVDVTVMVPLFDYARYLPAMAESVLGQQGVDLELIIVDDVSTDDGLEVARAIAAADPRVRVIAQQRNGGPVACVHAALAVARGEFLWYLDADDLITPGSLARAVALARAFPSVDLVYGHPLHFADGTPLPAARTDGDGALVWEGQDWLADRCRTGVNVITSCEVLQRRSAVDEIGGPLPLPHTYDFEMWLRLASAGEVAYLLGVDQGWHRKHPLSVSVVVTPFRDLVERRLAFSTFFTGRGAWIPNSGALRAASEQALAIGALEKACQLLDGGQCAPEDTDDYRAFAEESYAAARELPQWRRLAERRRLGARFNRHRPRFVAQRLLRRIRSEQSWRRWRTEGVYR